MKRILLFAAMLLTLSFSSKAQHQLKNGTHCDVEVTRECYMPPPLCTPISSTVYLVGPGSIMSVPGCPAGAVTVWKVCFLPNLCTPPSVNCTTVDGNPALSPCGPGTYTGNIMACDTCVNSDLGAIVTYNPLSGALSITP